MNAALHNLSSLAFYAGLLAFTACAHDSSNTSSSQPTSNHRWQHKAFGTQQAAEKFVGGFLQNDRREYELGLTYIAKAHLPVGSFTIERVIEDQRKRERELESAQREQAAQAVAPEDARLTHGNPDCLVVDNRTVRSESDEYLSYIVGKVRNTCSRDFSYVQVQVSFFDGDGNLADSGLANVNDLAAGETWSFKVADLNPHGSHKAYRLNKITGF